MDRVVTCAFKSSWFARCEDFGKIRYLFFASAIHSWMTGHPGSCVSIKVSNVFMVSSILKIHQNRHLVFLGELCRPIETSECKPGQRFRIVKPRFRFYHGDVVCQLCQLRVFGFVSIFIVPTVDCCFVSIPIITVDLFQLPEQTPGRGDDSLIACGHIGSDDKTRLQREPADSTFE